MDNRDSIEFSWYLHGAAAAIACARLCCGTFDPGPRADREADCRLPDSRTIDAKVIVDGMASNPDELWLDLSRKTTVPDLYVIADKVEWPTVSLLGWCHAAELLSSNNRKVAGGRLFFAIRKDRTHSLHELRPQWGAEDAPDDGAGKRRTAAPTTRLQDAPGSRPAERPVVRRRP